MSYDDEKRSATREKQGAFVKRVMVLSIFIVIVFARTARSKWTDELHRGNEMICVIFRWDNMGLMGPGDEQRHEINLRFDNSVLLHEITYNHGTVLRTTWEYEVEEEPLKELRKLIDEVITGWKLKYETRILDGSVWEFSIVRNDGTVLGFQGYGQIPPRSDEIKKRVLKLVEYEVKPKLF